jgi:hypothetical protein
MHCPDDMSPGTGPGAPAPAGAGWLVALTAVPFAGG